MKMTSYTLPTVQSWLGQELETRGIDAVIYTRYILSILQQQDGYEPEFDLSDVDAFRFRKQKQIGRIGGKARKRKGYRGLSAEDRKKSAVLECLQSVTEEECGIEGLVEELCMKLKKVQEERGEINRAADDLFSESADPDKRDVKAVNDGSNQAERYYEAFPALNGSGKTAVPGRKPRGAWGSGGKAGWSVLHPTGPITPESKSASVSRTSTSPTGFLEKKQRARSLPSSLAPTRKNSFNSGRRGRGRRDRIQCNYWPDQPAVRIVKGREPFFRNVRSAKVRGRKGLDRKGHHHQSKGEELIFVPVRMSSESEPEQSLWEESDPLGDNERNGDFFLELAVHSMAESICRGIVDENDDPRPGSSEDENDPAGATSTSNGGGWPAPPTTTECFGDSVSASVSVVCDAEAPAPRVDVTYGAPCPAVDVRESDLAAGSPDLPEKGPWLESARSCLQATPTVPSPENRSSISGEDQSENTSLSEELSVVIDDEPFTQELSSPRNAPIGTGRGNDTLLRICNHNHSGQLAEQQQDESQCLAPPTARDLLPEGDWPCSEPDRTPGVDADDVPSPPNSDNIWGGFMADRRDSLAEGIRSSCTSGPSSVHPTSPTNQAFDMNTALWATYDTVPFRVQPPKVVTWDETILSPLVSHLKRGGRTFIEGGVYGSPCGSQSTSHYNSCSTSPGNDGGMRDLWGSKERMQELSAAASRLEEYFSPGAQSQSLWSDEQSIIEDSLADSPKFLSSRSSSRFDFAQDQTTSPPNSDRSSPTETDDMVSETEAFEETVRRKEQYVLESATVATPGGTCNTGRENSFISMQQDSDRLDANSNINTAVRAGEDTALRTGEETDRLTKDVGDMKLEMGATTVPGNARGDGLPSGSVERVELTPLECESEVNCNGSKASRALQFGEIGDPDAGGLSVRSVQSNPRNINRISFTTSEEGWCRSVDTVVGAMGTLEGAVGHVSPGGWSLERELSYGDIARMCASSHRGGDDDYAGSTPSDTRGHMSYFVPEVKTNLDEQLFPFEEEVFLKEEGLLAQGDSINYCEACSHGRHECRECGGSSGGASRLSRNSSTDDQDWEGSRRCGSRKIERGSYSSRPPEETQSKPRSSMPIQITNSR